MGKWATANLHSKREGMQLWGKRRKYASYERRDWKLVTAWDNLVVHPLKILLSNRDVCPERPGPDAALRAAGWVTAWGPLLPASPHLPGVSLPQRESPLEWARYHLIFRTVPGTTLPLCSVGFLSAMAG